MSPQYISPPDPQFFNAKVWEIVQTIPPGRVMTYGQIAALVPLPPGMTPEDYKPFGARWVGGAMAACPPGIPWQRVINSQGKISPRPGAEQQRELLEAEGVEFDSRDRVDLKRYGWSPQGSQLNFSGF